MATKASKKNAVGGRSTTTANKESAITSGSGLDIKRYKLTIWPEWNDSDINAEKWEASKKEDKRAAKSPTQQIHHLFDDPDGKLELPPSLKADSWKRPGEFIRDKVPVVLDTDNSLNGFDLITTNEHLHESEFLRHCISQIIAMWEMSAVNVAPENMAEFAQQYGDPTHNWCPWEHIYSHCKAGRGAHLPLYNNFGKYVVRLYWMGCWRKITIDDSIPFDSHGQMLLPSTLYQHELWPMLLTKALIKVASLDYAGGNPNQEFGDMSIIQCLTGWIPEAIPLQLGHMTEVWELMKTCLPEWKLPLQEWEKPPEEEAHNKDAIDATLKDEKIGTELLPKDGKEKVKEKKETKDKEKGGKEDKKDKKDKTKKEKEKIQEEKTSTEEFVLPEKPEVVMFATYTSTSKYPVKVSVLGEMLPSTLIHLSHHFVNAKTGPFRSFCDHQSVVCVPTADASEKLRKNGLSHMYSHPVYIAQTRSCPMEPPPPPVIVPSWKLIRPRKKKVPPHDEPVQETEEPMQIQCLEIKSPFINYKANLLPIPTDTHRPKSSLDRGGTRSRAEENSIEEGEENAPTPPPLAVPEPVVFTTCFVKEEDVHKEVKHTSAKNRQSGKSAKEQKKNIPKPTEFASEKTGDLKIKDLIKFEGPGEAGGLAPPPSILSAGKDDMSIGEVAVDDSIPVCSSPSVWMDFDVFIKCFRTLYVYHKSNTYLCNQRFSDMKGLSSSSSSISGKAERKLPHTPTVPSDNSAPFYLFVDNLAPTDIVVSYSVLARWLDPPYPLFEDRDRKLSVQTRQSKEKDNDKDSTTMIQVAEDRVEQKSPPLVPPGNLVAEPYSWKSLITGQPILRLRTTGTKSAVLRLPPGRHVLRFLVTSPLGHHIHMCSTVNFLLGDEETVMPQLTSESLRFCESATQLITNLVKCILAFSDAEQFKMAWADFVKSHCPYLNDKQMSKTHHFQIFNDALYHMLRKSIKDIISPEIAFAWRAFTFDVTSPNILAIPFGYRPDDIAMKHRNSAIPSHLLESVRSLDLGNKSTRIHESMELLSQISNNFQTPPPAAQRMSKMEYSSLAATASHRSSGRLSTKKRGANQVAIVVSESQVETGESDKSEHYVATSRQPSVIELVSAVKLQKAWRGYYVRKVKAARTPGTDENAKASENLKKCLPLIEANMEENGLFLLRTMFKNDPNIMPQYPFYKDEWSKISYSDYKGMFPDQSPMHWFLIFRDIFYVKEEMLVVPSVLVPFSTCILHVIDNDTGAEVPRVFQKVAPYVYKKNRKGYSFVAEARTMEHPLVSGHWRMRLIGSLNALPAPRADVCCNFVTKEIRDYYVPNPKNIIFRQTVKVKEDHFATLQMNTSKHGVYIKLAVLDNEEEVISAVGKGHVVIQAFTFLRNLIQEEFENRRSGSRASNKTSPPTALPKAEKSTTKTTKRTESVFSSEHPPPTRNSMHSELELAERLEDTRVHKYIIQATVLQNSWPLSETSWRFVQTLKEMEKSELKLSNRERSSSPQKIEKVQSSGSKIKLKGGKEKAGKDKAQDNKGSRPSSQQFDVTKPHWTLRVVSDAVAADEIEVKKDVERAEEIRAMKKAWEDAQPGRAAKALQSRLKYLNSHTIKMSQSEEITEPLKVESVSTISTAGTENDVSTENESLLPSQTVSNAFFNESETSLTLEPPPSLQPKHLLESVDITPFIRKTLPEPLYMDDDVIQKLMEKRQKEIAEFKAFREEVEKWRETDKHNRNVAKMKQLEQYQALQAALDEARDRINISREAIRQRFLEAERLRLEELANQEAAMKAEMDIKANKGKKNSAIAKKKK